MDLSTRADTCRTCLVEAFELNNVFDLIVFENEALRISDMISICMGLEIKVDDELTHYICHNCNQEITKFYMFRKKCFESEIVLKMKQEVEKSEFLDDSFKDTIKEEDFKASEEEDSNEIYLDNTLETETDIACDIKLMNDEPEEIIPELEPQKQNKPSKKNAASPDDSEKSDKSQNVRLNTFPTPQKCDSCREIFLTTQEYKWHMEVHDNETDYLCNVCGQVVRNKNTFREHMYRHANRNRCSICEKSFASPFQLRMHMYKHTGEKPHKCKICDAAYSQLSYLTIHMRRHTGEKPYKCRYCDKAFAYCSVRTKHEIDHQLDPSIRPFQCHICPKNFRKKDHYRKHVLTHTGEKSEICPYCDKAFLFRKGLKVHLKSHTGKKPNDKSGAV